MEIVEKFQASMVVHYYSININSSIFFPFSYCSSWLLLQFDLVYNWESNVVAVVGVILATTHVKASHITICSVSPDDEIPTCPFLSFIFLFVLTYTISFFLLMCLLLEFKRLISYAFVF